MESLDLQDSLDLDDGLLHAGFGSLSPTESGFAPQTTTPDFVTGQFAIEHELPQYGASEYPQDSVSIGEFQPPQYAYFDQLLHEPTNPGLVSNNYSIDPALIPLEDASWADLTGEAFYPDLWNTLPTTMEGVDITDLSAPSAYSETSPAEPTSEASEDGGENSRKKRRRAAPSVKRALEACFERHKDNPYITPEEIRELANETGLSAKQVRTFFANARARRLPRDTPNIDVPGSQGVQQNPMQRFLSTSPEDEGISEELVRRAAEAAKPNRPASTRSLRKRLSRVDAMSISDTGFSSNSGSSSSQASVDSANSRGPRRGRKRMRESAKNKVGNILRKPSDPFKIYQCTFCAVDFAQKYDWKRHEESVHLPQKEFICMPDGPTSSSSGIVLCVFCEQTDPDPAHLNTHNYAACIESPRAQRSFLRKDNLVQHLAQVHRCPPPKSVKNWVRPIERKITILCGLCGLTLPDWNTRIDHIASHFVDGVTMELWVLKGDGGILPQAQIQDAWIQKLTRTDPTSDGTAPCRFCPKMFGNSSNAVFHERQKHKKFSTQSITTSDFMSSQPDAEPEGDLGTRAQQNTAKKHIQPSSPARKSQVQTPFSPSGRLGGQPPPSIPGNIRPVASRSLNPNPHANWQASFRAGSQNMASSRPYTTSSRPMRTRSSMLKEVSQPLSQDNV